VTSAAILSGTTASLDRYRDPVWGITVVLHPIEQALLAAPLLRRLHFVAHAGASRIVTHQTYSRLEHTLGVFSLVAHFLPEANTLRVAALLHDIGHLPLSHTLEGLVGLNHHVLGRQRVKELTPLLANHGIESSEVDDILSGRSASPLSGKADLLNLDHLDSYVRSGRANGWLDIEPAALIAALRLTGTAVDTDGDTAEVLVDLVCAEAHAHSSWVNVAPASCVRELVQMLLPVVDLDAFSRLTDDELWSRLLTTPSTAQFTRQLLEAPHLLTIRSVAPGDPDRTYSLRKIYQSAPLVNGQPLKDSAPDLHVRLAALDLLPRDFAVNWAH
jgi:HD superfamily phosphohydrolase